MTIERAFEITGIKEDDVPRINIEALADVASHDRWQSNLFRYDKKAQERAEAWETILRALKEEH